IAEAVKSEHLRILAMAEDFTSSKENVFLSAINYIKSRHSFQCVDFIKRHLGWLQEERRVNPLEYYESGEFMMNSLLHGFLAPLRCGSEMSSDGNVYGYTDTQPRLFSDVIFLSRYLDPSLAHFIRVTDGVCSVFRTSNRRTPSCSHKVDRESMIEWLEEKKGQEDSLCPICTLLGKH